MTKKPIVIDDGLVAGNVYDKYDTRNPIARQLMDGFLASFRDLVRRSGAKEVHEIGCGEGRLSEELAQMGLRVRATDASARIVDIARQRLKHSNLGQTGLASRVDLSVASIYELDPEAHSAELLVCCEVLEHLEEPERALERLAHLGPTHILLSVPREPIWRLLNMLRLKYLSDLGNTPGHLQHWSRRSFLDLVSRYFEPVDVLSPFPWTMVLCRPRPR